MMQYNAAFQTTPHFLTFYLKKCIGTPHNVGAPILENAGKKNLNQLLQLSDITTMAVPM